MSLPPRRITPERWTPVGVAQLEPNALAVVRSQEHRSVLAGPGAGKTELLAQRAAYLLQTGLCPGPQRILAISFKRDAARNLAERVARRCHRDHASRLDSLTFDAFAKSLVDRFGQALPERWRPRPDYEIVFPKIDLWRGFIQWASTAADRVGTPADIHAIATDTFERSHVLAHPLPEHDLTAPSPAQWAGQAFWRAMLHAGERSRLTFPMLGRLAELILRLNPMARLAFSLTYSHVFMDEFQDTTQVQYDLMRTIFLGTPAIVTAVGDNKQQIMRWALAMEDPFGAFEHDFGALCTPLRSNYRSSPALVRIQHVLAQALDAGAAEPISQTAGTIAGDCCAIWDFASSDAEARHLAAFVSAQMREHALNPRDFALLVRQKADDYARALTPQFAANGIPLRNEAAIIGAMMLQELLTEELSILVVLLLRISTSSGAGTAWGKALLAVAALQSTQHHDEVSRNKLARAIDVFTAEFGAAYPIPPRSEAEAQAMVSAVIAFLGRDRLGASHPAYAQGGWLGQVEASVAAHLMASAADTTQWQQTLDAYDGIGALPLMTLHKSKGLEYHTVIFVGLDDSAWWSYRRDTVEATAGFFVAFTRAKQRVVFTYCPDRGNRCNIAALYALLQSAGVQPNAPSLT
ncbi:UvrD-helicase domain-containing protein [Cupriavidus basilensis]|uniref:UvrD-helicase domain-containing protein n=1 Tax=Cupriavidus basilensis TaxID=68895 RepID=UPI00157B8B76|nr:ATP-dependent helicase [Cupriavidus basilensis]NUA25974.1 ATP-dependent helicase [Cupriavidus basilensis]